MNPDLLIVCATAPEMSGFLGQCPDNRSRTLPTGHTVLSWQNKERFLELLVTGLGVFNTVHALSTYLCGLTPNLIVNAGIAGVFEQTGLQIGDLGVATQERYIHSGVRTDGLICTPLPFDLISEHSLTREGIYPFDPERVSSVCENLVRDLSGRDRLTVIKGPFITVSAITGSSSQAGELYAAFSPVMEAMEGAACAHVAECHKIPMVEIRAASNFAGERDKRNWNVDSAVKNLGLALSLI